LKRFNIPAYSSTQANSATVCALTVPVSSLDKGEGWR